MDPVEEPLGRNHDFRALLSTQGVSSIGDAVSFTALPLLVFALTGSGAAMGAVGALQTLPDLFFGMVAGALADRSNRKKMMFIADSGRAVLTALIPISVWLGGPTLAVIRDLGLQAWALGLLLTVYGAGTVTGALLISRRRRGSAGPLLLGGNLARGLMLIAIGLSGRLELLLPLGFVAGIADSAVL